MAEQIKNTETLNNELSRIDWKKTAALGHAANILADVGVERLRDFYHQTLLLSENETWLRVRTLSRRKPTHTKVYLGGAMPDSLSKPVMWAHDYKQPLPCAGPYVDKYHNHRSGFVSVQLEKEGYTEDRFTAPEVEPNDYTLWTPPDWDAVTTTEYKLGDICVLANTRDIHRVRNHTGALTLVVNAPRKRHVTQVFNDDGSYVTYPDTYQQLSDSIARATLTELQSEQTGEPL